MGYKVVRDTVKLNLVGMTCANCASRIERGLNKLPGVKASVNYGTESAHIEYIPTLTNLAELQKKVADLGYQAFAPEEGPPDAEKAAREEEKSGGKRSCSRCRRFFLCLCFCR